MVLSKSEEKMTSEFEFSVLQFQKTFKINMLRYEKYYVEMKFKNSRVRFTVG